MRDLIGRLLAWFLAPQLDSVNARLSVLEMATASQTCDIAGVAAGLVREAHDRANALAALVGREVDSSAPCRITTIDPPPPGYASRIGILQTDAPSEVTRLSTVDDSSARTILDTMPIEYGTAS